MQWIAFVFALVAGCANPFQSGANAALKSQLYQPIWATVWIYGSGLVGVLVIQAIFRQPLPTGGQTAAVAWWAWMGGLISILATFSGLMFAQKMGSGLFTGVSVTASVVASILLDHFGMLGMRTHAMSPMRTFGAALMIGGVWLVAKF
jgi:transporter family-2 protein